MLNAQTERRTWYTTDSETLIIFNQIIMEESSIYTSIIVLFLTTPQQGQEWR